MLRFHFLSVLLIWRELEQVRGEGWWAARMYGDQLVEWTTSIPLTVLAVDVVGGLYENAQYFSELETLTLSALEDYHVQGGDNPEVQILPSFTRAAASSRAGRGTRVSYTMGKGGTRGGQMRGTPYRSSPSATCHAIWPCDFPHEAPLPTCTRQSLSY